MHGTRALITAPTAPVLSLDACKVTLGISGTGQDAILTAAIGATVGQLDPASGGWLGRALRPQTWEYRLDSFYAHHHHQHRARYDIRHLGIEIPYPPLIEIVSVKYDDLAGAEQTLTEGVDFRILGVGTAGKQVIAPLHLQCWPAARCDAESVRIRFTAGYSPAVPANPGPEAADQMPVAIIQAVALGARMLTSNASQNLYLSQDRVEGIGEQRYIVSDVANSLLSSAMEGLLSTYRVFG